MYTIWGNAIMSSDHLFSCIDNVLRQQDGFEGHLIYKQPDTLSVPYIMFSMLKYNILRSTYVEI